MNAVLKAPIPSRRSRRRPLGQLLVRSAAAHVYATVHGLTTPKAADTLYDGDNALQTYLSVQRSIVDPATTSVPEWAGNLVSEQWDEFVALLPDSVYARLAQLGVSLTFAKGNARFPSRGASPRLAGDFIGENAPIPVKKGAVTAPALTPKKVAVISTYSREVDSASGKNMERFLRTSIAEDTAPVIDARLLDNNPATAIRPAGLLNGITLTPSSGITLADIVTDVKAAIAPILLAGGGRRLVLLVNPLQALSLALTTDAAGSLVWPDAARNVAIAETIVSNNVQVGTIIALDAAEFATAADPAPQFYVSNEATLHLDDAADTITNTAMAAPVVSLFQQDLLAIRMVQQMNWTMRRPGMVAGVNGIQW